MFVDFIFQRASNLSIFYGDTCVAFAGNPKTQLCFFSKRSTGPWGSTRSRLHINTMKNPRGKQAETVPTVLFQPSLLLDFFYHALLLSVDVVYCMQMNNTRVLCHLS